MPDLRKTSVYRKPTASSIIPLGSALEAEEPERDRLGGPAPVPPVVFSVVPEHAKPMTHTILSMEERIEIQGALSASETQRAIAERLGRSASAISAELKRNSGRDHYCAQSAHRGAHQRMGGTRRGYSAINQMPPIAGGNCWHAQARSPRYPAHAHFA
jgi:hypothetical protein